MNSWADESEDNLQPAPASHTGERPKLNLKPRSQAAPTQSTSTSKSSIFGAAKPREEVLQSKGIDPSAVEKRVERKASVVRLTAEQNRQVESLRAELTDFEEKLREANENELPEEEYRVAAEEKRTELNALMKQFEEVNLKEGVQEDKPKEDKPQRKFERPSERRRRLEQQRRQEGGGGGGYHHGGGGRYNDEYEGEDPFASFGGRRDRRGSGRGRGGYNRDEGGGYNRSHGGGYNDRGGRGSYSGRGNRSYDDHQGGGNRYNDDKYAGDRFNY